MKPERSAAVSRRRWLFIVAAAGAFAGPAAGRAEAAAASDRAAWLQDVGWGVMIHFLPEWVEPQREWTSDSWNELVDGFDAVALADQLAEVGAGYCLLSIGQNSGFYLAPNATLDRLVRRTPSRCSRRDVVADLAAVLAPKNIRLMVYLPSGPPSNDAEVGAALGWEGAGEPNRAFQNNWERVIRDWSQRWRGDVAGWWFDGCSRPNIMYRAPTAPNFASFAAAARAGNSAALVAFSPGLYYPVFSLTPEEDYTAGLIYDFERTFVNEGRLTGGKVDGVQLHVVSFLGRTWGRGQPRFTAAQVEEFTRKVIGYRGAVTWDVPVRRDGTIEDAFVQQLRRLKNRR